VKICKHQHIPSYSFLKKLIIFLPFNTFPRSFNKNLAKEVVQDLVGSTFLAFDSRAYSLQEIIKGSNILQGDYCISLSLAKSSMMSKKRIRRGAAEEF
jgi:hypothetical protein